MWALLLNRWLPPACLPARLPCAGRGASKHAPATTRPTSAATFGPPPPPPPPPHPPTPPVLQDVLPTLPKGLGMVGEEDSKRK